MSSSRTSARLGTPVSRRIPRPLVALFTAGYLAPYLLPTIVGRLGDSLHLPPAQAGVIGSALLMSSAAAGFTFAGRVDRIGPRTLARCGLLLAALGYGTAAATSWVPLVVLGAMAGGFGSGTATTVAATGIAAQRDPHRASTLGLLSVSALAGALYLTLPHLGPGHALPFAAIALTALATWPATASLGQVVRPGAVEAESSAPATPLPYRRTGLVLAGSMVCWSMAQNSLWGVSSRIGTDQAGLTEVTVGAVFAVALGTALVGVLGAGALGTRLGRAVPIGAGTALIACCIVLSARADGLASFATGEIAWNTFYPVVLSYLIGLAASLDPRGRWAVLVGSASSLGTACGPLTGSVLSQTAGYPAMGTTLAVLLLVLALPLTAVALHTSGRLLLPGTIRRRGVAPAALVAGVTGAQAGAVPQPGTVEQPVVEITVSTPQPVPTQDEFSTAGPRGGSALGQSSNANASTSAR
ncbi:MFS transporter [Streptomyces sp. NPDC046821]|uniref:MFS transporter n=1 Tax=Streptomyces sp. NPDC046821 TaxID=3154702 RepID=UPI00340196ED